MAAAYTRVEELDAEKEARRDAIEEHHPGTLGSLPGGSDVVTRGLGLAYKLIVQDYEQKARAALASIDRQKAAVRALRGYEKAINEIEHGEPAYSCVSATVMTIGDQRSPRKSGIQ